MSTEEIKTLRRKLKKARESGKLQEISECCCNLAAYLSDEEEHDEALSLYKESLRACEALGNKEGVALANRMIAEECINLGYFEDALKHVTFFLKYATEKGDKVEEQRGFVLKGHVYFTQAEFLMDAKPKESKKVEQLLEQSMEAYRRSFVICTAELNNINEKERMQMKARLLQNKSLVLSRQKKLEHAQAHLIRAIKICVKEKLNDTEHICYLSLGDLYIKKGEPEKALIVYDKAFELSHSTQKKRDSLVGKAKTFIVMENLEKAKTILKKAYKFKSDFEVKQLLRQVASVIRLESSLCSTPDTDYSSRKDLYKKLGDTYCSFKNYNKGIKCYLNMLGCAQKGGSNKNDLIKCYNLLCKAFTNDKQYDKALFYSHQEVESLSKWAPEKAYKTYLRIGKLHELNGSDFEEIQFAYNRAKTKALQFENRKLQIKCLKHLIRIGKEFNKPELAQQSEKELLNMKNEDNDSGSSCSSGNESESDASTDTEKNSEPSSESDFKDLISDSDVENEEYDRPRERCRRTKFTIKRNEKGETDLHVACIKGNYKRVKLLIDQGHPVNVRDTAGWTPLHEACNHGYVDVVNILLDYGASINDKGGPCCDGTTPLHDAAVNGQLEVIETLIKRGASTLVLNDAGQTPLQCLLAWEKQSAMDADEEAIFQKIVEALRSPLDSEDIKRHLKPSRAIVEKKQNEPISRKSSIDLNIFDVDSKKSTQSKFGTKTSSAVSEYKESIELLRRNRHRDSDSSEENEYSGTFRKISRKKEKSARQEYEEAIQDIRRKPKTRKNNSSKPEPKPALIDEKEYVDNCIMENDDDEELHDTNETLESQEQEKNEADLSQPFKKLKTQNTPKKTIEEELKIKPWLKSIPFELLEDSFDLSPEKLQNEILNKQSQPEKENLFHPTKQNLDDKVDIIVKIFNEKVNVIVNKSGTSLLKVDWLIEQIAKQRPAVKNSESFVTLRVGNDPVEESTVLENLVGKEVDLVMTKWKSLPLSQRYEKVCAISSHPDITTEVLPLGFKHSPNPHIVEIFKKSLNSRCINLSNLKLSSLTLIPICKAIKFETFLQSLNLSNNYIGDKGIELIVKIFEKCIIEELDVSGCSITSLGIYRFSEAFFSINDMSKNGLEVLSFSNNPITDDAIPAFNSIIENLSNLKILNISGCELDSTVSATANSTNLVVIQGTLHR